MAYTKCWVRVEMEKVVAKFYLLENGKIISNQAIIKSFFDNLQETYDYDLNGNENPGKKHVEITYVPRNATRGPFEANVTKNFINLFFDINTLRPSFEEGTYKLILVAHTLPAATAVAPPVSSPTAAPGLGGRRRTRKTRRVKRKVSKAKKSRKFRR